MNGAVSNLAVTPRSMALLSRELRSGGYDVVHVHEPNAPVVSWFAIEARAVPLVGTFHTYSTSRVPTAIAANVVGARRLYNKLSARIAVSEAAALDRRALLRRPLPDRPERRRPRRRADRRPRPADEPASSCSSAAPRSARACRCCCARFEALRGAGVRRAPDGRRRDRRGGRAAAARPRGRATWPAA